MKIAFGFPAKARVAIEHGGQTETVDSWKQAHVALTAEAGRVNVVDAALSSPSEGKSARRPDGKTTLNLLDLAGEAELIASLPGDRKAVVRTGPRKQALGHPGGEHFWLPIDANNRFVCEPGMRHRKMYVSKSPQAMTRAQIAAHATAAGTATTEAQVTGAWLAARPQYGGTPQMAVTQDVFALYFSQAFSWTSREGRSDHYFFERGHGLYEDPGFTFATGENEIHPILFSSYGTGSPPILKWVTNYVAPSFCVQQNIEIQGYGRYWYLFASAVDGCVAEQGLDTQNTTALTVRNCLVEKPWHDAPQKTTVNADGLTIWLGNGNHIMGMYSAFTDNILVDGYTVHHAGWADGYSPDGDATRPQPPSKYGHALYFDSSVLDITIRSCLLSQPSSCGFQMRSGLHVEGNLVVDANLGAAWNSGSGADPVQFVNGLDNVIVSAGHKRVNYDNGAYDWGYDVNGALSSMKGNVLAHHANPDDAAELAARPSAGNTGHELSQTPKLVNDTQVWRWGPASNNRNVDGLDAAVLNQTTIQRYAGSKLGKPSATIAEFAAWAMAQPDQVAVTREAVDWFKGRFGKPRPARTAPATLAFLPDPDFEGFRWDNRYNWSTGDLPGRHAADAVDLHGHYSKFGNMNADIAALTTGGGDLDVVSGRLTVGTLLDAARINVRRAGQVYIGNAARTLAVTATSGRVNLRGSTAGLDLAAPGHAEVLLGPDCTVPAGKSLSVGGISRVGWTGAGSAKLAVAGTLGFASCLQVNLIPTSASDGFNTIRQAWRSIGQTVTGSISGATARIAHVNKSGPRGEILAWLTDITGTFVVDDVVQLARRVGSPASELRPARINALKGTGIPQLQRVRTNGADPEPTVAAAVTLAAGSTVTVNKAGLAAGTYDLTGPGVTVADQGATLPAGVTVTGGKLVLTV